MARSSTPSTLALARISSAISSLVFLVGVNCSLGGVGGVDIGFIVEILGCGTLFTLLYTFSLN